MSMVPGTISYPSTDVQGTIWVGDNLPRLRHVADMKGPCVDLIITDPPFGTQRDYEGPAGSFTDKFGLEEHDLPGVPGQVVDLARASVGGGMAAYLSFMGARLIEMHRILKSTGSIYVHCDPTASHYLKAVMDAIWGAGNFRNEVVWDFGSTSNAKAKKFLRNHDNLLFYVKDAKSDYVFNDIYDGVPSKYQQECLDRGWNINSSQGKPRLNIYDKAKTLAMLKKEGKTLDDFPVINYPDVSQGQKITDIIRVPKLVHNSAENTGWPTQKPVALYQRLIEASSTPDDIVMDPFVGCGTACLAAQLCGRRWSGMELDYNACQLTYDRLVAANAQPPVMLFDDKMVRYWFELGEEAVRKARTFDLAFCGIGLHRWEDPRRVSRISVNMFHNSKSYTVHGERGPEVKERFARFVDAWPNLPEGKGFHCKELYTTTPGDGGGRPLHWDLPPAGKTNQPPAYFYPIPEPRP